MNDEDSIPESVSLASFFVWNVAAKLNFRRIVVFICRLQMNESSVPVVTREPREDVPGEAGDEQSVEPEVEVEEATNSLPFQPKERSHDRVGYLR